jgi:hypothetical protein
MKNFLTSTIAISLILSSSIVNAQSERKDIDTNPSVVPSSLQKNKSLSPSKDRDIDTNLKNLIKLNRAKNLARQAAEQANGGLRLYRAEPIMHQAGEDTYYKTNNDGSITFTFKGRLANESVFTILSVVTVDLDREIVTMNYNGEIPTQIKQ